MDTDDRPLVQAGWVLGFAVEAPTLPFSFNYFTSTDDTEETVIDLNLTPGTYSVGSEQQAFVLYSERVQYSYGAVIDPCK